MSKLIESLKTTSGSPQPMGFMSTRQTIAGPRLLIIASLNEIEANHPTDHLSGADALLVTSNLKSQQLKIVAEAAVGIPWGCSLDNQPADKLASVIKAGGDFVTFTESTPLKALPGPKIGRILEISCETAEKLPRVVNDSPVDAVCLVTASASEPLTWHHLLLARGLSNWLSKPLLFSIPDKIARQELQALWDAGIAGIVAPAQPDGNITRLREIVDKLDYPARHSVNKQAAVLPFYGINQTTTTETDEDEDEDEDY